MVKFRGPRKMGDEASVHRCESRECDIVWIGKAARWKRSVPANGEAVVCECCFGEIVRLEEEKPRAMLAVVEQADPR